MCPTGIHSQFVPPDLSLVVLAHNGLDFTRRCIESLEQHTGPSHEIILVDNASSDGTAEWMAGTGHIAVLNETNLGFARGMNCGLEPATGDTVVFVNNDTVFPPGWGESVLDTFATIATAAIVAPAVTKAGNPATVRSVPGQDLVVFEPFGHLPSGVVYAMPADLCRRLGGWNEDYLVATGEDLDLLWTVWVNGFDVVLDERVLIEHISEATRRSRSDMEAIRVRNLEQFLDRWTTSDPPPQRISECPPDDFQRNLRHAAAGAMWLRRLVESRAAGTQTTERLRGEIQALRRELADVDRVVRSTRRRWFRA